MGDDMNKPDRPDPKNDQPPEGGDPKTVPYARFKEINDKFRALETQVADMTKAEQGRKEKELAEQQKFEELANQYKTELETERLNRLRIEAASQAGLPVDLAARLQGGTVEELAADAARLKEFMKPSTPGTPPPPPRNGLTPVFTAEQLNDPAFVRENAAKILQEAAKK